MRSSVAALSLLSPTSIMISFLSTLDIALEMSYSCCRLSLVMTSPTVSTIWCYNFKGKYFSTQFSSEIYWLPSVTWASLNFLSLSAKFPKLVSTEDTFTFILESSPTSKLTFSMKFILFSTFVVKIYLSSSSFTT